MTLVEFLLARIAEDEVSTDDHWQTPSGFARLNRECAAKRQIVLLSERIIQDDPYEINSDAPTDAKAILVSLAAVYADHPDFSPELGP